MQNKLNSDSDASKGANDVSSAELDQSTNHHFNTDSKNNDDSLSYDTTKNKIRC